jgi:UDP-N-acetylglucosamine 2-epimerase (non-hydrolysing)
MNPDLAIICPVHHSPAVRQIAYEIFPENSREILFTEPLDVVTFHNLLARASLVLTDSGGLQEEAPTFGVPIVLLRETTERPEGLAEGLVSMVGSDEESIIAAALRVLSGEDAHEGRKAPRPLYGDGYASERICDKIEEFFAENGETLCETC